MIRVLVAEDERPLLRGIRLLVEGYSSEFSVVECARNGREAIDYIKENPVDVIFTDINMPLADGLDVMKCAEEYCPGAIKVVISGYSDFEYAQKAISYGVKGYLLKPIENSELERILLEILSSFEKNRLREQENRIKDAVYGGKQKEQGEEEAEEQVQMAYFCAGPFIKEGLEESVFECDFWNGIDVEQEVCVILSENIHVYSFEKNQANERVVLLVSESGNEIDMHAFAAQFITMMKRREVNVTAAYCQKSIRLGDIPSMGRRLRNRIKKNILFGEQSVVKEDDMVEKATGRISINSKESLVAFKEAEILLREREHLGQEECMWLLKELIKVLWSGRSVGEEAKEDIEEMVLNLILYSKDIEQLLVNLRQMLGEKDLYKKEYTTLDIMHDMETYIKTHMTEQITASVLASEFGLVAPYLSKLFKEYSGYTPAQYIQKIRLERAKKLLETKADILAKDVAEMVGYPNPLYFSKVFKKNVGVYPSEYRNLYLTGNVRNENGI